MMTDGVSVGGLSGLLETAGVGGDEGGQQSSKSAGRSAYRYKAPEPWVSAGSSSQLGSATGPRRSITMGIDFGTAFAKFAVGLLDKIYIVDWSGVADGEQRFTLPGELSVLGDGTCLLGRAPDAQAVHTQLKHPFIRGTPTEEDVARAIAFIALLLRYARGWLFHEHASLVRDQRAIWSVNIGMPSQSFENERLKALYHRMAGAAWEISCTDEPTTLDRAASASKRALTAEQLGIESLDVIPEFVAIIASYVRSPQRQSDLHVIMDVGAGTVDLATFNVHQIDGENVFPIFSSDVSPLGTHFLTEKRMSLLPEPFSVHWDDFSPLPTLEEFCEEFGQPQDAVHTVDKEHVRQVCVRLCTVLQHTRFKRYRLSPKWTEGLRLFLCGGGSGSDVFQRAVDMATSNEGTRLSATPLPVPLNIEAQGLAAADFHRVAVAYGLGIYAANLGRIEPAAEVPDDEPLERRVRERPDRDELYPK